MKHDANRCPKCGQEIPDDVSASLADSVSSSLELPTIHSDIIDTAPEDRPRTDRTSISNSQLSQEIEEAGNSGQTEPSTASTQTYAAGGNSNPGSESPDELSGSTIVSEVTNGPEDVATLASLRPGTKVLYFGDYEIHRPLGRGGMGVVYMARQISLNRPVALKMVRSGILSDESELRRFQNEAEAIALLDHPGIVKVFEVGTHGHQRFLSMQLLEGGTLSDRLETYLADFEMAARFVIEAADAIQHAHMRGILHRDLKPSNVLIDSKGKPCITDFGLAKFMRAENEMTASGEILGTPSYMSPEQAAGNRGSISVATDVYGLGAILYAMITGSAPFSEGSVVSTLDAVRNQPPVSPRKRNAGIPYDLELICLKCLEKRTEDRYSTAEALADDLNRWVAGEPVSVRAPGTVERIAKWARRKPTLAAAWSLGLLSLSFGGLGSAAAWNWRAASVARDFESLARNEAETARDGFRIANVELSKARSTAERLLNRSERVEYGRSIEVALQEWQRNRAGSARKLLDATRPELRGWEWNYVDRLCNSDLMRVQAHEAHCDMATFSRDGSLIVSSGGDGTVRIWRAADGSEIRTIRIPEVRLRYASLDGAAKRLITACSDNSVRIWDVAAGTEIRKIEGLGERILSAAFAPAGDRILATDEDKTIRVWDVATGSIILGFPAEANWAAFSPDGSRIVAARSDQTATVHDSKTGETKLTLKGHSDIIGFATFSPDGSKILTSSGDDTARLWNASTGAEILTLKGHTQNVAASGFSPDGSKIVTASMDGSARIWNANTGEMQRMIRGHTGFVWSASFAPDGKRVLTSGFDGTFRIWNPDFDAESIGVPGQNQATMAAAFGTNGSEIISSSEDGVVKIRNSRTLVERLSISANAPVWNCSFTPDGSLFAFNSNTEIIIHDARSGRGTMTLAGHSEPVIRMQFARDGSKLVSTDIEGTTIVWDLTNGKPIRSAKQISANSYSTALSPDGTRILGVSSNVSIQDTVTGEQVASFPAPSETADLCDFSPDGKRIFIVSEQVVHVIDATTGASVSKIAGHTDVVRHARFSPDGTRLATASQDNTIKIWDTVSGAEVLSLAGHSHYVNSVEFSPDGRRIVSTSWDGSIKIWDSAAIDRIESRYRSDAADPATP